VSEREREKERKREREGERENGRMDSELMYYKKQR